MMASHACTLLRARESIFAHLSAVQTETVGLRDSLFRVIRENLIATFTMPPYPQSTMDGYAISNPKHDTFRIVHEIPAGSSSAQVDLKNDEAAQVFTGSILPKNTWAVVPIEDVTLHDSSNIILKQKPDAQQFILKEGADFFKDNILIGQPRRLSPRDVALLASLGKASVVVSKRPKIYILSTGSELIAPGTPPRYGKIYASNGYAIEGLCTALGGEVEMLPIIPDDAKQLETALEHALEQADLIVTIGGASVGKYDLVKPILKKRNAEFIFERVQTRPGRPIFFACTENCPILGLPGNPASASVGSWLYLADMLQKLMGCTVMGNITLQTGILNGVIATNTSNFEIFHRANIAYDQDGQAVLTPLARQESGLTYPTALADALIRQSPHADAFSSGSRVAYLPPPRLLI